MFSTYYAYADNSPFLKLLIQLIGSDVLRRERGLSYVGTETFATDLDLRSAWKWYGWTHLENVPVYSFQVTTDELAVTSAVYHESWAHLPYIGETRIAGGEVEAVREADYNNGLITDADYRPDIYAECEDVDFDDEGVDHFA